LGNEDRCIAEDGRLSLDGNVDGFERVFASLLEPLIRGLGWLDENAEGWAK